MRSVAICQKTVAIGVVVDGFSSHSLSLSSPLAVMYKQVRYISTRYKDNIGVAMFAEIEFPVMMVFFC